MKDIEKLLLILILILIMVLVCRDLFAEDLPQFIQLKKGSEAPFDGFFAEEERFVEFFVCQEDLFECEAALKECASVEEPFWRSPWFIVGIMGSVAIGAGIIGYTVASSP